MRTPAERFVTAARPLALLAAAALLVACGGDDAPRAAPPSSGIPAAVVGDSVGQRPEDAVAIVRAYLAALAGGDSRTAAELWEPGATAGTGDSAAFARAHADSALTGFGVGPPGDVGAAAGSRYLTIPIVADLRLADGQAARHHGAVTLRRTVVDGASARQRRWRITRVEWQRG